MITTLLASVQQWTGMPGQIPPRAAVADPGLRHRHPQPLITLISDHGVDDDGAQHRGCLDDHDVDLGQVLPAPAGPARTGVGRIPIPVEGLAPVRHPTEARVQQLPQRNRVPGRQRRGARLGRGQDLVALVHRSTLAPDPVEGCRD